MKKQEENLLSADHHKCIMLSNKHQVTSRETLSQLTARYKDTETVPNWEKNEKLFLGIFESFIGIP